MKIESLRASNLKVGVSLDFEGLNGNPARKFEAGVTSAKTSAVLGIRRWSHGAAPGFEFESLQGMSLKFENWGAGNFETLEVGKMESSKLSTRGGLKV